MGRRRVGVPYRRLLLVAGRRGAAASRMGSLLVHGRAVFLKTEQKHRGRRRSLGRCREAECPSQPFRQPGTVAMQQAQPPTVSKTPTSDSSRDWPVGGSV